MNTARNLIIVLIFMSLLVPANLFSKIGVGVGTGKIEVEEKLKPGTIYNLPELTFINTGDEPSDYTVGVQYRETQEEEKPPSDWFSFSPQEFYLEPGESQIVDVSVNIPVKGAKPVKYFAFLFGSPTKKADGGQTTIGVAAAAKLYFELEPGNMLIGIYYRLLSLYKNTLPWSNIALGTVLFLVITATIRKFVKIDIGIKKKNKTNDE